MRTPQAQGSSGALWFSVKMRHPVSVALLPVGGFPPGRAELVEQVEEDERAFQRRAGAAAHRELRRRRPDGRRRRQADLADGPGESGGRPLQRRRGRQFDADLLRLQGVRRHVAEEEGPRQVPAVQQRKAVGADLGQLIVAEVQVLLQTLPPLVVQARRPLLLRPAGQRHVDLLQRGAAIVDVGAVVERRARLVERVRLLLLGGVGVRRAAEAAEGDEDHQDQPHAQPEEAERGVGAAGKACEVGKPAREVRLPAGFAAAHVVFLTGSHSWGAAAPGPGAGAGSTPPGPAAGPAGPCSARR
jgi:hypothetical protein